jgi:hypothetical protein
MPYTRGMSPPRDPLTVAELIVHLMCCPGDDPVHGVYDCECASGPIVALREETQNGRSSVALIVE